VQADFVNKRGSDSTCVSDPNSSIACTDNSRRDGKEIELVSAEISSNARDKKDKSRKITGDAST
jgi:hypothetical protein